MLFDAINTIKRQSILTAILLMVLGLIMILCPKEYVSTLITIAGYVMIIVGIEQTLEFLTSKNSLMNYISFVLAVIIGIVGLAVLVFNEDILQVLSWACSLLLLIDGGHSLYYAFTFARRSDRKGWQLLVVLSLLLMLMGLFLFFGILFYANSITISTMFLMKILGIVMLFAAICSAIRLIWIWPVKNDDGGNK